MKKKVCKWLDGNEMGGIHLIDGNIKACCTRSILLSENVDYSTISGDEIRKIRRDLYTGINDGTRHECDGCALLIEKDEKDIDIEKLGLLTIAAFKTCNLRCKYCYYCDEELGEKVSDKATHILPIIKNFFNNNLLKDTCCCLGLAGGESTLIEDIPQTFEFLSSVCANPILHLQSNSSIKSKVPKIIEGLKNINNLNKILYTSIDAGTPETYENIRGRDLFYDTVNNLYNYAINGTFHEMQLKYILLDNKEKNYHNLSDEDIFGFCHIVKLVAENNQHKTCVVIDKDLFTVDEPMNDFMSAAGGKLMYVVENLLDLEIKFMDGGLGYHSIVGRENIAKLKEFAKSYKDKTKSAKEEYYLNCLSTKNKEGTKEFLSSPTQEFCIIDKKLTSIQEKLNKPTVLQQIFSVRNEGNHKVLRILGIKIKFKKRQLAYNY